MTQPGEDLHQPDTPLDGLGPDPETPDADALEQAWPANPQQMAAEIRVPMEADEADAVEQAQVVDLDADDDYR